MAGQDPRSYRPSCEHWHGGLSRLLPIGMAVVAAVVLGGCSSGSGSSDPGVERPAVSAVTLPPDVTLPPVEVPVDGSDETVGVEDGVVGVPVSDEEPVYFLNCADVSIAGRAPLPASDPRYRPDLDPDGDGSAC